MIDGVLSFSDMTAFYIMRAAALCGRNIPGDLAIMGIDGLRWCEFQNPPLTSIRQPVDKIGLKAFEVAEKLLFSNEAPSSAVKIKPELLARESTTKDY